MDVVNAKREVHEGSHAPLEWIGYIEADSTNDMFFTLIAWEYEGVVHENRGALFESALSITYRRKVTAVCILVRAIGHRFGGQHLPIYLDANVY